MRRKLVWEITAAAWLGAIIVGGLAVVLTPIARGMAGGVAAGLAIAGSATGMLAMRLAASRCEATAVGGRCDGQSFSVPGRHPPRTIRLVHPDGWSCRYKRRGLSGAGPVIYRAK
jgi:hypothetical protein